MRNIFVVLFLFAAVISAGSQTKSKLINDIGRLVLRYEFDNADASKLDPKKTDPARMSEILEINPDELSASIITQIGKKPAESYAQIIRVIGSPGLTDSALSVYMWALSHTKQEKVADDIIGIAKKNKKVNVQSVVDALDRAGTEKAKDYLFGMLDTIQDDRITFAILSSLAGHKYAKALPFSGLYLKEDMNESYWKMMIVFGKYGSACEPFLMDKINDADRAVRYNSIFLLGNVLLYPGIAPVVIKQYGDEKDVETRKLMLTVAINLLHDMDAVFEFLKKAAETEKDKETAEMARKYAADRAMVEKKIADYRVAKKVNRKEFQKEYDKSMKSLGKECDFYAVSILSDIGDEGRLVRMRENFLLRNSDECLLDLNKMNLLILYNRFIVKK